MHICFQISALLIFFKINFPTEEKGQKSVTVVSWSCQYSLYLCLWASLFTHMLCFKRCVFCHLCRGECRGSDTSFATRHFSVNFHGCLSSDVCSGVSTAEVVSVCVCVSVEVCVRSNVKDHLAHSLTSKLPSCVDTTRLCLLSHWLAIFTSSLTASS